MNERLGKASASKFALLVSCPGQPALERQLFPDGVPDNEQDEDAAAGTRIHRALQTDNTLGLKDSDELERYKNAVEYEKRLLREWMQDFDTQGAKEGERELRLWLHNELLQPVLSGQIDRHFVTSDNRAALIEDFKTGWSTHLSPAEKNWQLRVLVVLLKNEIPTLERIRAALNKAMFRGAMSVDYVDYSEQDIENSTALVYRRLWESQQTDAPRRAGGHCYYCPCMGRCPEAGAFSLLPGVIAANTVQAVSQLQPTDWKRILVAAPTIEKIIDEVKRLLKELPDDDLTALGLKRTAGKKLDPIVNVVGAYYRLCEQYQKDEVLECMSFSKERIAALTMRYADVSEEEAKKRNAQTLAEFIEEKKSSPSIKTL